MSHARNVPVASKVEELAGQVEANNAAYIAVIGDASEEELARICPDDGRTVGVVAHHMATVLGGLAGLLEEVRAGRPVKGPESIEQIDQMNDDHARDHAGIGRKEVVGALRTNGDAFAAQVRALDDPDLERSVGVFVGNEATIGQVIQYAVIGHQEDHLASIKAALGR